ncbi:MAG: hypothetical protein U5K54_21125 [Cytophagales bacterium]|nr:hypothetical protein [Cytophagales bacterium]
MVNAWYSFMLGWGIALILIGVPVLVYFFGKSGGIRSWVCGCGGLAETLAIPFRQLSNKTCKGVERVERWMIHSGAGVCCCDDCRSCLYLLDWCLVVFVLLTRTSCAKSMVHLLVQGFAGRCWHWISIH